MVIDFKFKNYMSFADKCDFTMLANSDKAHSENLITFRNSKISKARVIYGANASGKSSFVCAMDFFLHFLRNSNYLLGTSNIGVNPFRFREDAFNVPSEFSITFTVEDVKYIYSFSCTRQKVINEKLDAFYSSKPTCIFERTDTNNYIFKSDIKKLNDIKSKNSENKLFLVTSATWEYEKTKPVVEYLLNNILISYDIDRIWKGYLDKIIENNEFAEYKQFCLNMLNDADISINDFAVDSKKVKEIGDSANVLLELVQVATKGNGEAMEQFVNSSIYRFITTHEISDGNGVSKFNLNLEEESLGTVQMFMMSPLLYYVFKDGKTLFVDEIDKSLHPILVEHIFKLFLDENINTKNAQLIANTHDTNLLNLDIFRRDDIWFTERDVKSGKTEMYSLSDFSPRKDENIEKAYLLGRYGAIPFIKE